MRNVGTVVRGIRTPVIKEHDNLEDIVIESLMKAKESEGFEFKDKDVVAITEAVVGITEGNYATVDQIAYDIKRKFPSGELALVFPSPFSRNRFGILLKGIARAMDKITICMTYPKDEEGNSLFDDSLLEKYDINPYGKVLEEDEYNKYFGNEVHIFTGINYVNYYRELVTNENCEVKFIFTNKAKDVLNYSKNCLVANIHERFKTKKILKEMGAEIVYGTDEILTSSVNGSGYNSKYGLLGSNKSTEERVKLFPEHGDILVNNIQKKLKDLTGKNIEVMVYGDGAFKDPVGGIWELADPVVSPAYTKGLEGTPNELKLKFLSDNKFANLKGEELIKAMKEEIKKIIPKKKIKPIIYQIKTEQTIMVDNFLGVKIKPYNSIVFYGSDRLEYNRYYKDIDSNLFIKKIKVPDNSELIINGYGIIKIKKKTEIELYLINNIDVELRKALF